jgi:hypothetical protein
MESEGDESPVADLKRIMIRKCNKLEEELKENMQNQFYNYQENIDKKKLKKTQKQLHKLRISTNSKMKLRRLI